ncbi:MAG TPA: DUF4149 domain-containing protein [Burkholderiales bacterium]|nr:DUF4149 domain-containing protein [Burkholderiales bacterium]
MNILKRIFRKPKIAIGQANFSRREIVSIHQFSKLAMTFWLGGSWMVALVMFPMLFRTLDQITASDLVGQILNIMAYIGIVCLIIALIEVIINHKLALIQTKRFWYIMSMGFILIINNFAVFPVIYKLRQKLSLVAHQVISVQNNIFDFWHSLSSILFILSCIIGVFYLIEM